MSGERDLYDALDLLTFDPGEELEHERKRAECSSPEQARALYEAIDNERHLLDQLEEKIELRREQLDDREPATLDTLRTFEHDHD